ncbi:unnamed protein product [Moneuplotes crassus]|uniref:Uncharacterized protein n=1 Tax=Euplotes crassus TaxID=5936 RepID=A0AAD1XML3_EUPCR|nr:unnamed protein product [Moneuplotes crassus]
MITLKSKRIYAQMRNEIRQLERIVGLSELYGEIAMDLVVNSERDDAVREIGVLEKEIEKKIMCLENDKDYFEGISDQRLKLIYNNLKEQYDLKNEELRKSASLTKSHQRTSSFLVELKKEYNYFRDLHKRKQISKEHELPDYGNLKEYMEEFEHYVKPWDYDYDYNDSSDELDQTEEMRLKSEQEASDSKLLDGENELSIDSSYELSSKSHLTIVISDDSD